MRALTWVIVSLTMIAVVLLVVLAARRRRTKELRGRFGSDYERPVGLTGNRRRAEDRLADGARRRNELTITHLDPVSRAQFDEDWLIVQSRFVDDPTQAVTEADGLVVAVMRVRGYPVEDFEERAWLLATDHADVVEHYRQARAARTRYLQSGRSDIEDLRQAFTHYRMLYGVLSGSPEDRSPGPDASTGTAPEPDPGAHPDPGARPPPGMD